LESSKLASIEIINESLDWFGIDFSNSTWEGVLNEVFSELDESKSWAVFCSNTTILSELSLDSFRSGWFNEKNLSSQSLSGISELLLVVLIFLVAEED
jgi:hypothetical protein